MPCRQLTGDGEFSEDIEFAFATPTHNLSTPQYQGICPDAVSAALPCGREGRPRLEQRPVRCKVFTNRFTTQTFFGAFWVAGYVYLPLCNSRSGRRSFTTGFWRKGIDT